MFDPIKLLAAATVAVTLAAAAPALAQTASRDLTAEEANRELVIHFYNQVFNEHDVAGASEIVADDYIQHNPRVATGKAGFVKFATGLLAATPTPAAASYAVRPKAISSGCMFMQGAKRTAPEVWPSWTSSV